MVGAVGVIGVGIAGLAITSLIVWTLVWFTALGTMRKHPSVIQRLGWLLGALVLGAALGLLIYGSGPSGLIGIPVVFVILVAAANTLPQKMPETPEYVRIRLTVFVALFSIAALASGLTIFL